MPRVEDGVVVVPAPGEGPGNWAGAPDVVLTGGTFWLAYRVRRPLEEGRGITTVVARSDDGVRFDTVCEIPRETFGAASFERPALVALPDGGWRIYLSCATPDTKHWWVEAVDADTPKGLADGRRTIALPGDAETGVKDPVVVVDGDGWHLWLCCHPLIPKDAEDRMTTRYLTSSDGLTWVDEGEVLAGTPATWDARGTRVTAVLSQEPLTVLYDGRATADENWFERTGIARADGSGRLVPLGDRPALESPEGDRSFRYATTALLPDGSRRWYAEVARADGSHDLRTWLVPPRPA